MSEFRGATVEEAIAIGLNTLGLTREAAEIKIISEDKKGFLGIGKKEAIVSVSPLVVDEAIITTKESIVEPNVEVSDVTTDINQANEEVVEEPEVVVADEPFKVLENLTEQQTITELALYLTKITTELGAPALVRVERQKDLVMMHLDAKKAGVLIGKHGRVLNAIQYLAQVFVHRVAKGRLNVVVNVGDYRERRQEAMEKLARRTARKVEETGQAVFLEPMPAFERKLIHGYLTEHPYVETHSEGEEPHRYLVVEPKHNVF
ncbi:RNA-binding cell elongation regulator Jag/EloR [Vagococcus zengguangii]|uniref:RNA-binding protein KhpB n=1 Tax=Vagococcus zengguangii TaxID=2571750 RepID=A0A4D7D0N9_9ENTE|nr:RNA-binding cell elongation regulator Jag/EloR [Vagococcus zengguangii]QCI87306.1 protein jag [Vagococcus zengguangii]TLG79985.1 protein jag [Vagococcus zengguangii]